MRISSSYVIIPLLTLIVALLGRLVTKSCDAWTWYQSLQLPALTPPNWVFAIAWNIIFVCTAISAIVVWNSFERTMRLWTIMALFIANACLNIIWTYLFFWRHDIGMALIDAIALEAINLALIVLIGQRSRIAALLLFPYLIWVGFAIYLNTVIWISN